MRSEVIRIRSAELLPAATVVISPCVSDKDKQCLFSGGFLRVGSEIGPSSKSNMWN